MMDFLAAENWFEDERLEAIYRQISEGDTPDIAAPLATEYVAVLMQTALIHRQALLALAKQLDDADKGK